MKNLILFSILLSILLFCNCRSENQLETPEGVKWRYVLESIDSEKAAFIYDPIIYENIVIIPRQSFQDEKAELIALDKDNGEVLWTWSEAHDKYNKDGFVSRSYVYDGILAIGDNNYTAGINIYTGETIWEDIDNVNGLSGPAGVNEQIFISKYIPQEKYWIQKGNIYTGEWETIYELDKIDEYFLGSRPPSAVEWEGKTYITFHEIHWRNTPVYEANFFLNFYNVTDDSLAWKTDTIPIDFSISHTPSVFPKFHEGQILLANGAIYSYNMSDGKLKWKQSYGNSFTISSDLAVGNGNVYGNNEDGYMVCLDVHTGVEYFNVTTGFSASRIEFYNNDCYMSAVSTYTYNQFMVVSGASGAIKHTLRAPYEPEDEDASFQFALTVDQETGLAYTADYKNFLCIDSE